MPEISEAERLRAKGVTVTLKDGTTAPLIYDFEAIAAIERDYDSLEDFSEEMRGNCVADCADTVDSLCPIDHRHGKACPQRPHLHRKGRKQLTAVRNGVIATLSHTGRPAGELASLLDVRQLVPYLNALTEAFREAMPDGTADPNAGRSPGGSPGNGSITSPRSGSVARTRRSGA